METIGEVDDYIRVGQTLSCDVAYRSHLLSERMKQCRNREEANRSIHSCRVFVATLSSLSGKMELFNLKRFDVAIVDEASQILEKLDNLLRYQLNDSTRREVFLTADIQFLTSFLELEKVRRDHFEYTIFQEGNMENICIPPLLFIPFVENAVKHNLDSDNLSYVHLYFSVHNKQLTFRCENSKPRVPVKREGGIGLANVKRRLDLLYESRYTLQIEDKETTYNVNLHLNL